MTIYYGYMINGYYNHTKRRDDIRRVQNSGVNITITTMQMSSSKDKNPIISDMTFYDIIKRYGRLITINYILFYLTAIGLIIEI